jgi:hypothetical protein
MRICWLFEDFSWHLSANFSGSIFRLLPFVYAGSSTLLALYQSLLSN